MCVFDLDHTLVHTPLDLAAMALDMRALLETRCGPLPARPDRYRVGELIHWCQAHAPDVEKPLWEIALDHERRAMAIASLMPGARGAIEGARAAGFATAVWTNNAREVSATALQRFGHRKCLVVVRHDGRAGRHTRAHRVRRSQILVEGRVPEAQFDRGESALVQ